MSLSLALLEKNTRYEKCISLSRAIEARGKKQNQNNNNNKKPCTGRLRMQQLVLIYDATAFYSPPRELFCLTDVS